MLYQLSYVREAASLAALGSRHDVTQADDGARLRLPPGSSLLAPRPSARARRRHLQVVELDVIVQIVGFV
jgi:hypothetical protein